MAVTTILYNGTLTLLTGRTTALKHYKTVTTHKALGNGSIILMHNGAKFTADALDTVLTNLEQQGYEIVPISQLILKITSIWIVPDDN